MQGRRYSVAGMELLEVGLTLPLETFLVDKLEGLVARGFDVTISAAAETAAPRVPARVGLVQAPGPDEGPAVLLLAILRDFLRLALRRPVALIATLRAARRPIQKTRGRRVGDFLLRLRSYLPLALLDPDVVHFEWASGAISLLPMARVWGCPAVLSCRGSNINVLPHAPESAQYVRALQEV